MYRPLGMTVSRHIMDLQRMHPEATGDLSGLLSELIVAAKTISAEVNMAGLADVPQLADYPGQPESSERMIGSKKNFI